MMPTRWRPQVAFTLLLLASPTAARADPQQCIAASEGGQRARDEGKYQTARASFITCSADSCPATVRRDCLGWLEDLQRRIPTVVVAARLGDRDLSDVRVRLDGAPFIEHLDGKPVMVDPGEHVLLFEHAGDPPVQQTVVVHAGEKDRPLSVSFGPGEAQAAKSPSYRPPWTAYTAAGLSVLGGVGFAYFGLRGHGVIDDCRSSSNCDVESTKTHAHTDFVVADTSLGLGLVAAGLGLWLFLRARPSAGARQPAQAQATRLELTF